MTIGKNTRPYVILNAAISLDGKIATYTRDSRMSSPADIRRVHRLRVSVDAIMVGLNTLLTDDPKLTVKFAKNRKPKRIIVDSMAQTPLKAYVVRTARDIPTIIATTTKAPKKKVGALTARGVQVLTCGTGPLVSVKLLFRKLRGLSIRRLLLEGGGTLNWSMINNGLVNEISVAITPRILGGERAVSLVRGKGVAKVDEGVKLRLVSTAKYGPDLVVRYRVLN